MTTAAEKKAAEEQVKADAAAQAKAESVTPKMLIVTKTFRTQGKDKKRVEFLASDKPQNLGEHAAMAIKAGVAIEQLKADE